MSLKELGAFIAGARKRADLTQAQLAQKVGVGLAQVSRWERGENVPTEKNMARIVDVLHLCDERRQQAYQLYGVASHQEAQQKVAASRRDMATMRQELREALDGLSEAMDALAVLNQFVLTYQAFHAAYQQMGIQVDRLVGESAVNKEKLATIEEQLAVITQAVLRRPRQGRP
jgi:transcriptional regulator with XRE-family HTH domain